MVDETSIYNRALTADEIAAIYAAGGAGKCKSPLGVILSRDTAGDIVARLTLNNTTSFTAANAVLTLARGSTLDESAFVDGVPVPQAPGTVGPNQNVTRTVTLPGTGGVPGGFVGLMRANVTFDGGAVSLTQQITTP